MPGFDGTGPDGRGSMTGGGRGYCAVNMKGQGEAMAGFRGRGRGRGAGYGRFFYGGGRPLPNGRPVFPGGFAGPASPEEKAE
ncbi:MAG: DUF5320 domain-containing protein [Candidatus Omnitrophota bacterium]|jgi:hypothetical protein